ncbi:Rid family hydrolase [Virgibacillus sp. SK37]|uniref:Rid family hydrolase n=1 Tax=Virgibacillus sp. SK37 TaxID=403957 RepID=UPI0004D19A22|nr:Rid family hydrolase [Virgibacillus sp. SK37]AIF44276.1 endoribonuclease [Virgibacillus sp. SK37]
MKEQIYSEHAPRPTGPYSQGVKLGDFIFVSGQDGYLPNGSLKGNTVAEQTEAALTNIKNILMEKGAGLENIVHMTCHLSELTEKNVKEFNKVYELFFETIAVKPARITVGSQLLCVKVEITAIACMV